jgi:hypothetical protein
MISPVIAIIEKHGPMLTSRLAKRLTGVSPAAARKRIERSGLRRLPVKFPHNDRFLYLESQYGKDSYFAALYEALKASGSALGVALSSIEGRGGVVGAAGFAGISGAPGQLKKHLSAKTVLASLETLKLVSRVTTASGDVIVSRNCSLTRSLHLYHSREVVEQIFLSHMAKWLRNIGVCGWGTTATRNRKKMPNFAQFDWDLCGPSYLYPFKTHKTNGVDPGFVVADVVLGKNELQRDEIEYFVRKCTTIRHNQRMKPFLAMLVANSFSEDAFKYGRGRGVMLVSPRRLFGEDVGDGLQKLLEVLTRAGAYAAKGPENIEQIFLGMAKIEGAAANIRGPLFELIVGHAVHLGESGSIDIGMTIDNPDVQGRVLEIDVFLVKGRPGNSYEVKIYECKGKLAGTKVDVDEVKKWVEERVPTIRKWAITQPRFSSSKMTFEFWTTTTFTKEAIEYLESAQSRIKLYNISWKDGGGVASYVRGIKADSLLKTLNEHYLKHPISKH